MIEYIVIFVIVGWAVWFTARHLWRESKGKCANCYCGAKNETESMLIQLHPSKENNSE